MSDGGGRIHPPSGVGIVLALGLLLAGVENHANRFHRVAEYGPSQSDRANQEAHREKRALSDSSDAARTLQAKERAASEAAHDKANPYSRPDLQAQQGMAVAAWVQLVLSLLGIVLLWRTLGATREAVAEAGNATAAANTTAKAALADNKILQDEQRPWLTVQPPKITELQPIELTVNDVPLNDTHHCFSVILTFEVVNSGVVPATDVRIRSQSVQRLIRQDDEEMKKVSCSWRENAAGDKFYDVGPQRFFETFTGERLFLTFGLSSHTIGQGRTLEYPDEPGSTIIISKAMHDDSFMTPVAVVISIAYKAPGKDEIFESHFAFDLCGIWSGYVHNPPRGPTFASGENIFYRQAESRVK